mmetsp:Transcript_14595/g.49422  ORF Transcript_14595/g.49422 Transcript_14595/m.49422 type:complete len:373 (+) Transcript_14595:8-1126(+)
MRRVPWRSSTRALLVALTVASAGGRASSLDAGTGDRPSLCDIALPAVPSSKAGRAAAALQLAPANGTDAGFPPPEAPPPSEAIPGNGSRAGGGLVFVFGDSTVYFVVNALCDVYRLAKARACSLPGARHPCSPHSHVDLSCWAPATAGLPRGRGNERVPGSSQAGVGPEAPPWVYFKFFYGVHRTEPYYFRYNTTHGRDGLPAATPARLSAALAEAAHLAHGQRPTVVLLHANAWDRERILQAERGHARPLLDPERDDTDSQVRPLLRVWQLEATALIADARAEAPDARLVWLTALTPREGGHRVLARRLNDAARTVAHAHNVSVVDADLCVSAANVTRALHSDGFHPSPAARPVIARCVFNEFCMAPAGSG